MRRMDAAAAGGGFALQECSVCRAVQYPPRELCGRCLSIDLDWNVQSHAEGVLVAASVLHHSFEQAFQNSMPLRVGMVRLDVGPCALCFVPSAACGKRVHVRATLDRFGRAVLTAEAAL